VPRVVGALEQGTTSTRFILFDEAGAEVARHQDITDRRGGRVPLS
jgi:glycerol kinase